MLELLNRFTDQISYARQTPSVFKLTQDSSQLLKNSCWQYRVVRMGFFQEVIFLRMMLTVQVEMRCTSGEPSFKYYLLNWIHWKASLSLFLYWVPVTYNVIYNEVSLPKLAAFYPHSKHQEGHHHQNKAVPYWSLKQLVSSF